MLHSRLPGPSQPGIHPYTTLMHKSKYVIITGAGFVSLYGRAPSNPPLITKISLIP